METKTTTERQEGREACLNELMIGSDQETYNKEPTTKPPKPGTPVNLQVFRH